MIGLAVRLTYKSVRQGKRLSDAVKADAEHEGTAQERMLALLDPDQAEAVAGRMANDAADAPERGSLGAARPSARPGELWDTSRSVPPPS